MNRARTGDWVRTGLAALLLLWPAMAVAQDGAAAPSPAAAPTPVEPLDLYRLEQPLDPQLSPDGQQIAVLRQTRAIQTDRVETELWLVAAEGSQRRLLVGADRAPASARWSPDGQTIAFIGREGGKPQILAVGLADGRARVLTALPHPPAGLAWSPDGTRIAFVSLVESKPEPFYELPPKPETASWAPAPRIVRTYPYRTDADGWLTPGERHVFVLDVAAAPAATPVQISSGPGDWGSRDAAPAWTPDGQFLVVSADTDPAARRRANQSDLWVLPAVPGAGAPRQLTADNGIEQDPDVSPDGTSVAYRGWRWKATSHQQTVIYTVPLASSPGAPARSLTGALDRPAEQPRWRADGAGVHFLYQDLGINRVGFASLAGPAPSVAVPEVGNTRLLLPSSGGGTYSAEGGVFAYPSVEADRPAALALWRDGRETVVWDLNAAWRATRAIGRLEEIWTPSSADGRRVHGWVLYPPDFDPAKSYPLALDIHGGPHIDYGPMFSITHHLYAAAGYVVLFTNPRGSIGYGEEFANLINRCYPCQDHDDLMSSVEAVAARGFIDRRRMYIGGGSGGGVLSAWATGRTNRFAAASVKRPVINWTSTALTTDIGPVMAGGWFDRQPWEEPETYWRRSPLSQAGTVRTPTLIITGESDWRTPMSDSEQYFQALQLRGIESALMRLPDASHGFGRPSQWLAAVLGTIGWYDRHIRPETVPADPVPAPVPASAPAPRRR
jgi:dipeptidyl aminopeptidase/acylaminoacyl peptidase